MVPLREWFAESFPLIRTPIIMKTETKSQSLPGFAKPILCLLLMCSSHAARAQCDGPPSGLIAWWPGNGNANDLVGNCNGTLVGGVTFAPGKVGQAFSFDGATGYVQIGGSYNLSGSRTIEGWVFPSTNSGDGTPIFVGGASGAGDMFGIAGTSGNCNVGQYNLYVDHWGYSCVNGAVAVAPNTWNHVAMTFDGTNILFYVNGVAGPGVPQTLYNYNLNTATIGGNVIGGSTTQPYYSGLMDGLSIYNRALSAGEIAAIYAAGADGKCEPPFILSQPASQFVVAGAPAQLSVAVNPNDPTPLSYQWLFNGTPLTDGGNVSGSLSNILSLLAVTSNNIGSYSVIVTNFYGSVTSSLAGLYFNPIIQEPANQVVTNGGSAVFSVALAGTGPFTNQWLFNGNYLGPIMTTVAGNGGYGFLGDGSAATNASVEYPRGVAVDSLGNLYFADYDNDRIRKVDINGVITTVAGNGSIGFAGDGSAATNAMLDYPTGVAVDSLGDLFIADFYNERIRKVDVNGIIATVAGNGSATYAGDGGAATNASLYYPSCVTVDSVGNLYIADEENNRVRKVSTNGIISTFAGNGGYGFTGDGSAATNATFDYPTGVAVDSRGDLFIADSDNYRVREVGTNGIITTVAGNGSSTYAGDGGAATNASLVYPYGVAVDNLGNLYIADEANDRIRMVATNGIITSVAGNGSGGFSGDGNVAANSSLFNPFGVAVDSAGNLFVADEENDRIRKVSAWPANLATLTLANLNTNNIGSYSVIVSCSAGSVTSSVATLNMPAFMVTQPASQTALLGGSIVFAPIAAGSLPLSYQWAFNGTNLLGATNASFPVSSATLTNAGAYSVLITNLYGVVTSQSATLTVAYITQPPTNQTMYYGGATSFGVVMSAAGTYTYQWQFNGTNLPTSGIITTLAGNGNLTFSGDGGPATNASLYYPRGVAMDGASNVYIADFENNRIRKVGTNGVISTVAGTGTYNFSGDGGQATNATLRYASGVAVDSAGNLFVADYGNYRIRKVSTNGIITTVAGNGTYGYSGDNGAATNAELTYPYWCGGGWFW